MALPTHYTAAKVVQLFPEIVVKHHGYPSSIVTDKVVFMSYFWKVQSLDELLV